MVPIYLLGCECVGVTIVCVRMCRGCAGECACVCKVVQI